MYCIVDVYTLYCYMCTIHCTIHCTVCTYGCAVPLQIFAFVLLVSLLMAVGHGVFESQVSRDVPALAALTVNGDPVYSAFLTFWSYIIVLNPLIPMALYISYVQDKHTRMLAHSPTRSPINTN